MGYEWVEIAVAVQQTIAAFYASCRDNGVDCLAHGHPGGSQQPVVQRRLQRDFTATELNDVQRQQQSFGAQEVAITAQALKDFGQDQVAAALSFAPARFAQEGDQRMHIAEQRGDIFP